MVVQNLEIAFQVMQYHSRRLTCSEQSVVVNSKEMSDQRMVISICGKAYSSLLSIFLISHLKTIRPCQTKKLRPRFRSKILLVRSASTTCVCKNKQQNSDPSLTSHLVSKARKPLSILLLIASLKIISQCKASSKID